MTPSQPHSSRERARAAAALAVMSVIWAGNWVAMKSGLAHASPFGIAGWRFLLAAVSLLPVLRWLGAPVTVPREEWRLTAILTGLLVVNFGATFTALGLAGAGKTAVLVYTMPFWVLLLARIFLHERMRRSQWLAVGLAAAGLVVMVDPAQLRGLGATLLAIGAGLLWGASIVLVKHRQGRLRSHLLTLTFWQMLLGSGVFFLLDLGPGLRETTWSPTFLAIELYMSVLATTAAWALFYYALARLPAGVAGLGTLATPVLGVTAAWLVFGEVPGAQDATGMVLIAAGLALLGVPARERAA